MGYLRDYSEYATREAADEAAVKDVEEYLGPKRYAIVEDCLKAATNADDIQLANVTVSFAGVGGRPFHALCRKYALAAYRKWMHSGAGPVQTDEKGFPLPD